MKKLLFLFFILTTLFANEYHDEDLDGVPDRLDRCPHTPFSDIVDEYGCSIERLIKPKQYEWYVEYIYAKDKDVIDFSEHDYLFYLTLYKGRFDVSITALYFDNASASGFSDTNIKLEYRFTPTPMWDLYVGVGVDLPLYNQEGNFFDYDIYISSEYYYLGYKLFVGGYYTYTRDKISSHRLQNPYSTYAGIEMYNGKYSIDFAYLYTKSKFGAYSNSLYLKLERRLYKGYYLYTTFTKGINEKALDSLLSIGFGQRF
ncbi:hypothetical protein [Nitratiruptor tergarcus]|uniref:Uncharacterized protein n=1 Tax=Nitratiruptor tergarcus DSM 16512 TaxID=1069081 RepID=A0A1W1WVF8_9BACT|nr:hypothetical protein [Nitratiruptor tergarcus]SMC10010.1 hypothetical protein SAMN05660197_1841 [Nitratiruptor tergarcus DSM 16512]